MNITLVNADLPSYSPVPPLGLLSLAAFIGCRGHQAQIRDYQLAPVKDSRKPETFAEFCLTDDPVLGISCSSMALPLVLLGTEILKVKCPELKIILGGIGPSAHPVEILSRFSWIDYIVIGEGELPLATLMDQIENVIEPVDVLGLVTRKSPNNSKPQRPERLRQIPSLKEAMISQINLADYSLFNIHTSRGCPYPCTFCDVAPYWERKCIQRPLDDVLNEISVIVQKAGDNATIVFVDDTLTIGKRRVEKLCQALQVDFPGIEWACYARVDTIDKPLMEKMSNAGCRKIYFGLESGSNEILKRIKKGFSVEEGMKTASLATEYFPIVQTSFMFGYPFETWNDFFETLLLMGWLVSKGISAKSNLLTPLSFSSYYNSDRPPIRFDPNYSPQLHLAGYTKHEEIVKLIAKLPELFCSFYYFEDSTVIEKYKKMRDMKLSPEDVWDIWDAQKAPVPIPETS